MRESDLNCLPDGEYLNDGIINFYLQYILNVSLTLFYCISIVIDHQDIIDATAREQVHMFSTFFFKKLQNCVKDSNVRILNFLKTFLFIVTMAEFCSTATMGEEY